MRQVIIAVSLIGSFVVFALTIDLLNTLVMFLLFGILPDRQEPLSAERMLAIYSGAAIVVVGYTVRSSVVTIFKLVRPGQHITPRAS